MSSRTLHPVGTARPRPSNAAPNRSTSRPQACALGQGVCPAPGTARGQNGRPSRKMAATPPGRTAAPCPAVTPMAECGSGSGAVAGLPPGGLFWARHASKNPGRHERLAVRPNLCPRRRAGALETVRQTVMDLTDLAAKSLEEAAQVFEGLALVVLSQHPAVTRARPREKRVPRAKEAPRP